MSRSYIPHILLADDDADDCLLFRDALEELQLPVHLTTVHNGEELMQLLNQENVQLPDILFLDLNMPRKNGLQCFSEIKQNERLKHLPIIIFSTSFEKDIVNLLYKEGALQYIRKPNEFSKLTQVINHALAITTHRLPGSKVSEFLQPTKDNFVL